jgi:hypothetical protein
MEMPMHRRRSHDRRGLLVDGARASLAHGLQAITAISRHGYARRSGRIAVTWLFLDGGRPAAPPGFVPIEVLRLVAFGLRLAGDGRGGLWKRAPLAVYRPRVDLPGSGRVGFECVVVHDAAARGRGNGRVNQIDARRNSAAAREAVLLHQALEDTRPSDLASGPILPRIYWAFDPGRPPVFEPTNSSEEWATAEVRIGRLRAWPAEMLVRPPGRRYDVHPVDGSPDPWAACVVDEQYSAAAGDVFRGRWLRRGGRSIPLAQEPAAIYASLEGLIWRSVRNPAYDALREVGLVPRDRPHREWVEMMSHAEAGRSVPFGDGETPLVAAFRERVAAYGASAPHAERDLLQRVRAGCVAAGVAVPGGDETSVQFLARLLMRPWQRIEAPGAAIQTIKLGSSHGPGTLAFSTDDADLDLGDFGDHRRLYEPLDPGEIHRLLKDGSAKPKADRLGVIRG